MKCCEKYAPLVEAFLDGELSQEEDANLREHLADCPGCQAYLQELLTMQSHFPTMDEVELPPDFTAGVMAAIRSGEIAAPQKKSRRQSWKVFAPLAACLALVVVLGSQGLLSFVGNSVPVPQSLQSSGTDALPEASSAEEDLQINNQLAKDDIAPVSEEEPTEPAAESDSSAVLTMQPAPSQYTAPEPPTERSVDDIATGNSEGTAGAGPSAFDSLPQVGAVSAGYVAELQLTSAEAGDLLSGYTALETGSDGEKQTVRYALSVSEAQALLVHFPDKALTLPEDGAGLVLVVVETIAQ